MIQWLRKYKLRTQTTLFINYLHEESDEEKVPNMADSRRR